MWAKVVYLAGAYLLTFVGALMFSVSQHRTYEVMDEQHSTHKDFTLKVDGLVGLSGSERVEEELKELLVQKSGHNIEAVSIGWDMRGREETIMAIIEEDLMTLHGVSKNDDFHSVVSYDSDCSDGNLSARSTASRTPISLFRSAMSKVEATFLCTPMQKVLTRGRSHGIPERHDIINRGKKVKHTTAPAVLERSRSATPAPPGEGEVVDVHELVCNLQTSGSAWVVFETEDIRNEVGCRFEGETLTFRGLTLSVSTAHSEPDSIKWENLLPPDDPACSTMSRVRVGLSWVIGGMFLWLTVFYMPFVWVSMRQTHSHGVESSGLELFVFGMVVCIGNVIMYTVCSEAADRMKFTFQRSHEVAYMVFYTAACMFNVFLDMVVTMVVAYHHLKGLNVRTHDGLTLDKVPTVTRILMTYGMQRELADNLLAYSFPGTFLIPFLIEPFAAVYVPYKLMTWLVGSHESIRFSAGETYLATAPFDLSRYADIHLNVILATLVLFFPGGNNLVMFFGLAVSHIWIYLYDHLRVLRFSPSFRYASKHVDWVAQWMSCIPTGLILSALAIKYNQMVGYRLTERLFGEHFGNPNSSNIGLVALGFGAFWLHVLLHSILFIKVVPLCGVKGLEVPKVEYRRVAQRLPFSWLTANPVGVLRSTYFYNHKVPLTFCVKGKEHLLKKNIELSQYFEDRKIEAEDYSTSMQSWRVPEECRAGPSDQL